MNVVVVNNQSESAKSKFHLVFCDWMLTKTFIPWDFLWTMIISDQLPAHVGHELLFIKEVVICAPVDEIEFSLPQLRVIKS